MVEVVNEGFQEYLLRNLLPLIGINAFRKRGCGFLDCVCVCVTNDHCDGDDQSIWTARLSQGWPEVLECNAKRLVLEENHTLADGSGKLWLDDVAVIEGTVSREASSVSKRASSLT